MKRFLTNLILVISIISILVIPSFAATNDSSDDIVILKQPSDAFAVYSDNRYRATFDVIAHGDVSIYSWEYSFNLDTWEVVPGNSTPSFTLSFVNPEDNFYIRCKLISPDGSYIYTRTAFCEFEPTNIFNFVTSCLRYITSYISLILNSLLIPGAPFFALLPVVCIGIAVAVLLIVIKITKGFSWGM